MTDLPAGVTQEMVERADMAATRYDGMFFEIFNADERKGIIAVALTAALAGRVVVPGWQPIDSAPLDGTPVLLGWPLMHPLVGHYEDGIWGELDSDFGFEGFPTQPQHWMPTPAGPAVTPGERHE